MPNDWSDWLVAGEELNTELRPSPFTVVAVNEKGVEVRTARTTNSQFLLDYARLNALARGRRFVALAIASKRDFTQAVNRVWEAAEVPGDSANESQYWAVVQTRWRRRRGARKAYSEGRRYSVMLSQSERDPALRRAAIKKHGYRCDVCRKRMVDLYGPVAQDYIQIHHLDPLAELGERESTVDDVVPVCANCHVMLHRRKPPFTPAELRAMIARKAAVSP